MMLLAAAALALQAPAEPPSVGVNYTDAMRSAYQGRRALEVVHQSARCIVARARSASEILVASVPDTRAEARVLYGPIASRLDQCAQMGVRVSNAILRGSIAEALYETAFAAPPAPATPVIVAPFQWPAGNRSAANLAPIYELGRCVAAGNPGLVHQLLATLPFSAEESEKLRDLRPGLAPCLDSGATFTTNRETLRAILAESLYRWASAQGGAPALGR